MTTNLKIFAILFIIFIIFIITVFLKKGKIIVKYSIVWYFSCLLLILFTLFPNMLTWFTHLFGIEVASNFIFALMIGFLFIINISLTIIVSEQKERIRMLIQELSLLKGNFDDADRKK
jgi:hypothetical protein